MSTMWDVPPELRIRIEPVKGLDEMFAEVVPPTILPLKFNPTRTLTDLQCKLLAAGMARINR